MRSFWTTAVGLALAAFAAAQPAAPEPQALTVTIADLDEDQFDLLIGWDRETEDVLDRAGRGGTRFALVPLVPAIVPNRWLLTPLMEWAPDRGSRPPRVRVPRRRPPKTAGIGRVSGRRGAPVARAPSRRPASRRPFAGTVGAGRTLPPASRRRPPPRGPREGSPRPIGNEPRGSASSRGGRTAGALPERSGRDSGTRGRPHRGSRGRPYPGR